MDNPMNMEPIINATDHAAAQGDRWLFVFLLMFLLAAFAIFFRWLLKDREAITKRLTDITDRHIEQSANLTEVVANNTAAFNKFADVQQRLVDEIREAQLRK
jgi:hypothetical protein